MKRYISFLIFINLMLMNSACNFHFRIEKRKYNKGFYFNKSIIKNQTITSEKEELPKLIETEYIHEKCDENILNNSKTETPKTNKHSNTKIDSNVAYPKEEFKTESKEINSIKKSNIKKEPNPKNENSVVIKQIHSFCFQFCSALFVISPSFLALIYLSTTWFVVCILIGMFLLLGLKKIVHQTIIGEREMKYPGFYLIISWIYALSLIIISLFMLTLNLEFIWPVLFIGLIGLTLFIIAPISIYNSQDGRSDYKKIKTQTYLYSGIVAVLTSIYLLFIK